MKTVALVTVRTVIVLSVLPLVSVALIPLLEVIEAAGAEPSPFTVTTCPTTTVPDPPSTVIVALSVTAPAIVFLAPAEASKTRLSS